MLASALTLDGREDSVELYERNAAMAVNLARALQFNSEGVQAQADTLKGMEAIATRAGRALDQYCQSLGSNSLANWEDYRGANHG